MLMLVFRATDVTVQKAKYYGSGWTGRWAAEVTTHARWPWKSLVTILRYLCSHSDCLCFSLITHTSTTNTLISPPICIYMFYACTLNSYTVGFPPVSVCMHLYI